MKPLGHALTYPIRCKHCSAHVFFHTNGNGDVVIFDDLGAPWPIHGCYYAYRRGELVESFEDYRDRMVRKYGTVPKAGAAAQGGPRTVGWTYTRPQPRKDP